MIGLATKDIELNHEQSLLNSNILYDLGLGTMGASSGGLPALSS